MDALISIFAMLGWEGFTQVAVGIITGLVTIAAAASAQWGSKDNTVWKIIDTLALNFGKAKNDPAVQ